MSAVASSALPVAFSDRRLFGDGGHTASQEGNGDVDPAPAVARAFQISGVILESHFDLGPDGFDYVDNPFRATGQVAYASGAWVGGGG